MTFWTTLRWAGVLIFALIVLASWLGAEHKEVGNGSSDQHIRPAPIIVR